MISSEVTMTFPVELRERVVHAVLEGGRAYAEVAGEFGVSEPSFKRWVGKHRRGESLARMPHENPEGRDCGTFSAAGG